MITFIDSLNKLIRSRRSTKPRLFNGKKIEEQVVWQILENANWAPNHGLTQPWRYQVFSGLGLEKLANFQANLYQQMTPIEEFKLEKYTRMKNEYSQVFSYNCYLFGTTKERKNTRNRRNRSSCL